jgi:spermidine synthase
VVDEDGVRTLLFDDAQETRMSLRNPLTGHFEYTDYFHMPWLWNTNIGTVLMIGLGGGTAQRSFERYYPNVTIETAEIDPTVLEVARNYFGCKESDRQKFLVEDGRMNLRRSSRQYDLIVVDAYIEGRYGPSIPQHLATKEFFELTSRHLTTNGVLAYNVMGTPSNWHAEIVGAMYRTLKSVFPQVYLFPARTSMNVVLVATRAQIHAELPALRQRASLLTQAQRITLPGFAERLQQMQAQAPASAARSPVLTDDYAPVEGLAAMGQQR